MIIDFAKAHKPYSGYRKESFMKHLRPTNKIIALLLTMVMLFSLAGGVAAESTSVKYTLSDVSNVLKYVAGWGDKYYNEKYDYNTDSKVSIFDAACLLKAIAGWDEDNICVKNPTGDFIRQLEAELETYHADQDGHYPGINYTVKIHRYYGTYNDAVVIYYAGGGIGYTCAETTDYVAGCKFHYADGNTIKVWKDGDLYVMKSAYEEGVLTKKQVERIAELHKYGGYISYK